MYPLFAGGLVQPLEHWGLYGWLLEEVGRKPL
jgi:hypothetical protein